MKKMIKYFCLFLLILCSCNRGKKENNVFHVAVLRGPSVIAFAKMIEDSPEIDSKRLSVDIVDSPEQMQALLIKGEADLAALPMINAANLYNKGLKYSLLGCPVWGNLYIVEKKGYNAPSQGTNTLHIFGAGTTPDILTRYYLEQKGLTYSLNYSFSTPQEISQGLLSGQIRTAVMAEPFLSLILRKDSTLYIKSSLNNPDSTSPGFAQTAIVYAPSLQGKSTILDSLLDESCQFAVNQPEQAIKILENRNIFVPGSLTPESIERCQIKYLSTKEAKRSILDFLRLIGKYEPKAIGGKVPNDGFMPEKQ